MKLSTGFETKEPIKNTADRISYLSGYSNSFDGLIIFLV